MPKKIVILDILRAANIGPESSEKYNYHYRKIKSHGVQRGEDNETKCKARKGIEFDKTGVCKPRSTK